jgi:hypothetical protein
MFRLECDISISWNTKFNGNQMKPIDRRWKICSKKASKFGAISRLVPRLDEYIPINYWGLNLYPLSLKLNPGKTLNPTTSYTPNVGKWKERGKWSQESAGKDMEGNWG